MPPHLVCGMWHEHVPSLCFVVLPNSSANALFCLSGSRAKPQEFNAAADIEKVRLLILFALFELRRV